MTPPEVPHATRPLLGGRALREVRAGGGPLRHPPASVENNLQERIMAQPFWFET